MKIEIMIYLYIAICVSMILYNVVYVFILRHREKSLSSNSQKFEKIIYQELEKLKNGEEINEKHKKFLRKKLDKTSGITAFDKALEKTFETEPEMTSTYLVNTFSVFEYLTHRYITKDTLKIAYFPYILYKYDILKHHESERLVDALLDLLRSVNVYCRENTLKAIYSMQKPDVVVSALKIIDTNLSFHHPKLICDGLMFYKGDKDVLKYKLLDNFKHFSVQMKVNILNYFRFANLRLDDEMLDILKDEKENREIRFSVIRYFEKFPTDKARPVILNLAENEEGRDWEYQAISTSALKSYPGDDTFRILVKNLSSSNWHVRQNSAISCEKLGYTYHDLINVFDGNDRYAREMMRYRLDRRNAEKEAVKV
ncbi:MAG: hypothetical protein E7582_05145 [Ruminococcaceae bacterium]|nr:hypothetical protein [Oscillospiraceae bacterium]